MPDGSALLLFSGAALALLLVPGPAVLYIVARSASQGVRAGLVSVAGIHVGTLVHIAAAVVGLSAVIVASAAAFTAVKLAGAGYLVYLGISALRGGASSFGSSPDAPERSHRRIFRDGVVLNTLNPKTAVFFLAFVPQFVDVDAGNTTAQVVVLGALFVLIGLVTDGVYALAAGRIGRRLRRSSTAARRSERTAGVIYLGLGVTTALAGSSS
ncbi:MAG: RhtB family transporter [Acidimicrobiales bacterium]|nr:MAG: RhtB family transporter [Acidimicrobiales bacterium]